MLMPTASSVVVNRHRPRLFGPVADLRHVAEADDASVRLRHHELREIDGCVEPALEPDRALVELALETADRRGQILRPAPPARPAQRSRPRPAARAAVSRRRARARCRPRGRLAATPAMPAQAARDVGIDHARQLGARQSAGDDSVSETIGWSFGSKRVRIGSSISVGRSLRMLEISSRISCVACCGSFSKTNSTMMLPKPSSEFDVHPVDAADAGDHFLDRLDDLALDHVRRRARVRHGDRRRSARRSPGTRRCRAA